MALTLQDVSRIAHLARLELSGPEQALMLEQQRTNRLLQTIVCVALGFLLGVVAMQVLVYLTPR